MDCHPPLETAYEWHPCQWNHCVRWGIVNAVLSELQENLKLPFFGMIKYHFNLSTSFTDKIMILSNFQPLYLFGFGRGGGVLSCFPNCRYLSDSGCEVPGADTGIK